MGAVPVGIGHTMKGTGVQTMTEIETTANEIESETREGGMTMMILAGIGGKEDAQKAMPPRTRERPSWSEGVTAPVPPWP